MTVKMRHERWEGAAKVGEGASDIAMRWFYR
jgi:hypothetical protein